MSKKKILLVEDEADIAKILTKRLSTTGYEVLHVADGIQAVQQSRAFKPDLVILDLMLPGGGGLKVLERLKMLTHTAQIPVVVLTGMQNETHKQEVIEKGVAAYFEKPHESSDLLHTIATL